MPNATQITTVQRIDDWNWSVREVNPVDATHGREVGNIRRQRNATSGPYQFAAWTRGGLSFHGEFPTSAEAEHAILKIDAKRIRGGFHAPA